MASKGIARGNEQDSVLTGHTSCTITTKTDKCSESVFVNGYGVCRIGDNIKQHTRPVGNSCVNHIVPILAGSSTVFADGIAIARDTDSVDEGNISSGSSDVFSG
jgi:uncharacterized Zn-binding protein involved in type VI secretion